MAKAKRRKAVTRGRKTMRGRRIKRAAPLRQVASAGQAVSSLKAYADDLIAQRAELDEKISTVEQALSVMGASTPMSGRVARPAAGGRGKGGRRGVRPGSLKDHIQSVMSSRKIMSVKAVTESVLASGYKTKNKTLAKSVGIALTEMPNIQKVARGKFRCK